VKELAEEIEEMVSSTIGIDTDLNINDVFILYGYQMETCLSVAEDSVDEEIISVCAQIAREIHA
jgi:hypothetical protein